MTTPEDTFAPPASWRRRVPARRDGFFGAPAVTINASARAKARSILEARGAVVQQRLLGPASDAALVEAARAALDESDPTPLGCGVLMACLDDNTGRSERNVEVLVDDLVGRYGVAFAAEAVVELHGTSSMYGASGHSLVRSPPSGWQRWHGLRAVVAIRMRTLLAAATDEEVDATRAVLLQHRGGDIPERVITSFLFPSERAWVEADVAAIEAAEESAGPLYDCMDDIAVLVECVADRRLLERLVKAASGRRRWFGGSHILRSSASPMTVADGVGPEAARVLAAMLDYDELPVKSHKVPILEVLAAFPTDEAFELLEQRSAMPEARAALFAAMERFPIRAIRLLGAAAAGRHRDVFRGHVLSHPEVTAGARNFVPPEVATVIEAVLTEQRQAASGADVPEILRVPPWEHTRKKPSIVPIAASGKATRTFDAELARAFVFDVLRADRSLLAQPGPFAVAPMLELVAGWMSRRSLRSTAKELFRGHATLVAGYFVPLGIGKPGRARNVAGQILRFLAEDGNRDVLIAAAKRLGTEAMAAMEAVLATDPAELVPTRLPTRPAWVTVALLPAVTTTAGSVLPAAAVDNLVTMLLLSTPGEAYAGVEQVSAACDQSSLAELVWALYQQWQAAGAPTKDGWVFEALGALGNDETVARLQGDALKDTSDPRVVSMLDAFVAIGSNAALLALKEMSEKVRTKRVRDGARAKVTEVAHGLGLTADQLADRLVPDLGLEPDGTRIVDYGFRRFRVSFDEQLRPVVTDEDGARLKDLPKPGVKDDPTLAPLAEATYKKLKKEVRGLADDQIRRLERAMVQCRRFTSEELRVVFLGHPLRWQLARRLLWATYERRDPSAACIGCFRVAEDRSFADVHDEGVVLDDDAVIGIAHPIHVGADLPRWVDLFVDYELLAPFPQLDRPVYFASPDQMAQSCAVEAVGTVVESVRFLGLERRGFARPQVGYGGAYDVFRKPLVDGREFVIEIEPGMHAGDPKMYPQQRVVSACVVAGSVAGSDGIDRPTFATIGSVCSSEILSDIAWLTS